MRNDSIQNSRNNLRKSNTPAQSASSNRKPQLKEMEYRATVGKITSTVIKTDSGSWNRITIPFEIWRTGVTVLFFASNKLVRSGRLYPIVEGILGKAPNPKMNLGSLAGKSVVVSIKHRTDDSGNVWETITAARPLR